MRARITVFISRGHLNEILQTDTGTWHFLGEFLRPKLFYKLTKVASIQIGKPWLLSSNTKCFQTNTYWQNNCS